MCSPTTKTCEASAIDAAADTMPVDATPDGCYGTGLVVVCPDAPVTGQTQVTISTTTTLDTGTSTMCQPYHLAGGTADTRYCVVAARTVIVSAGGRWSIIGSRPLVVIATNTMTIDGVVDAASHRGGLGGAGSNAPECMSGSTPTLDDGGPGGSFGGAGGAGGGADTRPVVPAAPATATITALRGGCGGRPGSGTNAGGPGRGGGALGLIADNLVIGGTINASGAAGFGAGLSAGGGGGGSGGMILLDANSIVVGTAAQIFANGAGGGEGGGGSNGGNDGTDSSAPLTAGQGGAGRASAGGDGGDGPAGNMPAGAGSNASDSGGGGGGGAGVIRVVPPRALGGAISPPPS